MKKILVIVFSLLVISSAAFYFYTSEEAEAEFKTGFQATALDVIGIRTGTSTTGVGFYGAYTASTTYITPLRFDVDEAIYTFTPTVASSSAGVSVSVLGSNDANCDTATTSPDYGNPTLTSDINWFDISSHLKGLAGSVDIGTATTTINWSASKRVGKIIALTDLNYRCIAVEANASSTILHAQVKLKGQ